MKSADRFDLVRKTQIALFQESGVDKSDFDGIIELLGPEKIARYLSIKYIEVDELPSNDANIEIAGVLDRTNKTIYVSKKFPIEQRRLTGMHEIIHWMLHKNVGRDHLHRDRPISRVPGKDSVDWYEVEATNYACRYLMPEKMVKEIFARSFGLHIGEQIEFNENVAFHLGKDIEIVRTMDQMQRAILLATNSSFGRAIIPLYLQFKVSPTAMAIRLKELDLLAPDRWRGKPNLRVVL